MSLLDTLAYWLGKSGSTAKATKRRKASASITEKGALRAAGDFWSLPDDGESTPEMRWPDSIMVYGRMRREEAQVASVLRAVKMPVRRARRSIDGTGCRPEVIELVSKDLGLPVVGETKQSPRRTKGRFNFAEHVRLALTSLDYGHSVFEQVYQWDERDEYFHLRKLGWRPPRTISEWVEASDGGLVAVVQSILGGTSARLEVKDLVVYSHEREESWTGTSLLRPAYKYWLLKDQLLRLMNMTHWRNGMGIPVYVAPKLPDGTQMTPEEATKWMQDQIDAGEAIAAAIRAGDTAGASLPNGATLALKGVEGKTPDPLPAIRYYDEAMARAVLAHFLNLGGEKGTGSWALGTTFADFFTLSLQSLSDWVDDTINAHVIEDLVDANFGPDEPAPRIVSERIGAALTAEALKALVDAGVITPDEPLEVFTRDAYGLPVRDPNTARQRPADATTAAPEVPSNADPQEVANA